MSRTTQKDRVLQYLQERGSITSLEAIRHIGCTRLSAVIFMLKEDGYEFEDDWVTKKNRWGDKVAFKKYTLVQETVL